MAAVTINEIRNLLQEYTRQQHRLGYPSGTAPANMLAMVDEVRRCELGTASGTLKSYARVIDHFYEKSKAKRVLTYEQAAAAIDLVRQGMDSVSAIKKARIPARLPHAPMVVISSEKGPTSPPQFEGRLKGTRGALRSSFIVEAPPHDER